MLILFTSPKAFFKVMGLDEVVDLDARAVDRHSKPYEGSQLKSLSFGFSPLHTYTTHVVVLLRREFPFSPSLEYLVVVLYGQLCDLDWSFKVKTYSL